ncbi:MAG: hypothetical protein KC736_01740 [Candidatus Moranbacteria bacterium]|nr:hypothetical protein [Candidatus Moranbacteria bacterium]
MTQLIKKMKNSFIKIKKGSALTYALILTSIVSVILLGIVQFVISHVNFGLKTAAREQSLHIAEAGVYFYRWYLAHQVEGKTSQQIQNFWQNENPYGVNTPLVADYEGIGSYSITVTPPPPNSTIVIVQVTGSTYIHPEMQRTVQVRFRRPSWSEFAVLADADIRFGDGTEIFGPLHSNGGVRFDGVAHNIVSSLVEDYVDPDTGITRPGVWTSWSGEYNSNMGSSVFLAGKEFPSGEQDFNGVTADLALMKDEAINGNGIYFNNTGQGRHIVLRTDGTADVRTVNSYNTTSNSITSESGVTNHAFPDGGVIYVEDNIWLEGQVDGRRVTIVAADLVGGASPNIFIENDITYSNYDGTDVIGIIGEGDVEIIRDSEDDLRIDGAMLAQNGRVGREHYGSYCTAWWWIFCTNWETDNKDTITVFGSIATLQRYGFAWTDGTGYTDRNLLYDNNLLYYPPPYFPTGTKYAIDLWEEL